MSSSNSALGSAKEWAAFLLAGFLWGSSFLWIKIGLDDVSPAVLVFGRTVFGLSGLVTVMAVRGLRFPTQPKTLRRLAFMSVLNPGVPFLLIAWAETRIDSSMASVLNSTVPLFTILIAHFLLADERMTASRVVGLVTGFVGIVVLLGRSLNMQMLHSSGLTGQLAVLLASCMYAYSMIYSRRNLKGLSPVVQTAALMAGGAVVALIGMLLTPSAVHLPTHAITWVAMAWLGLLGSCVAFICYFYVLPSWGATRTSLVNYAYPVVGVALGMLFRNEQADWRIYVGSVLVCAGIAIVNAKALWHASRERVGRMRRL